MYYTWEIIARVCVCERAYVWSSQDGRFSLFTWNRPQLNKAMFAHVHGVCPHSRPQITVANLPETNKHTNNWVVTSLQLKIEKVSTEPCEKRVYVFSQRYKITYTNIRKIKIHYCTRFDEHKREKKHCNTTVGHG